MKLWVKILLGFGGAVVLSLLLVVAKLEWDARQQRASLEKSMVEMKELADGIVRNQSKFVSNDDLNKFAKDLGLNLDAVRDDLKTLGAQVQGISSVMAASRGYHGGNLPSDHTTPGGPGSGPPTCPDNTVCPDPYGYLSHSQTKNLSEPFDNNVEVPIGYTTFEAWKEHPWTVDVLPRTYHVTSVLGQDEDGRHYSYSKIDIEAGGKKYPIKINKAEFQEEMPSNKFSWWNPKVGLGINGGLSVATTALPEKRFTGLVAPGIYFSPFSYGKTKTKPTVIFPLVGVGYDAINNTAAFTISPIAWNIGSVVSFINNTFLAPALGVDHTGRVSVSGGLIVTF